MLTYKQALDYVQSYSDEISRLSVEVNRLTRERDVWQARAEAHHRMAMDANDGEAAAARERDEAIAWVDRSKTERERDLEARAEAAERELACKEALIDDHLRKIMQLENRLEEEACKAEQLEADLKHVQGSDVGMMQLLHAEKLKTESAERQVATLRKERDALLAELNCGSAF